MPVISLNLKTLQPLLATSFQGDPNSDVSYDYIPGSMIRGALIGRYLKNYGASELDLTKEEIKRLFFDSNKTRYLNAYLRSKKGKYRTLPIPQSWYKEKGAEFIGEQSISIYDLSIEQDDEPKPLKSVSGQFCIFEQGYMRFYQPDRRINVHNKRNRRKGRSAKSKREEKPDSEGEIAKREEKPDSEGEIFRYDALDAGQVFQSIILCEENDLSLFKKLLIQSDLWLGGSRSAGYGHTQLSYEIHNDLDWQEVQTFGDDELDSDDIVVTLLSHTILRDFNGQFVADPKLIQTEINAIVGSSLLIPKPEHIFSSSTLIGGFNRKWGLPLPQVPALAAGTVVVFKDAELTEEQIQQLQWQGIGDRRNEGFGRIAINWHQKNLFDAQLPKFFIRAQQPSISATVQPLARFMAERLLRQRLEQALKNQVNRSKFKRDTNGKLPISNSQLSRLMLIARRGLNSEPANLKAVNDLLHSDNLTKTALAQFQTAKLQTNKSFKSFYDWLQEKIKNPHDWLESVSEVKLDREIEVNVNDLLATEYTLKLIIAVAKQATKEN